MKIYRYLIMPVFFLSLFSCEKETVVEKEEETVDINEPLVMNSTFTAAWRESCVTESGPVTAPNVMNVSEWHETVFSWKAGDMVAVFDGSGKTDGQWQSGHIAIADGDGPSVKFKTADVDTAAAYYIMVYPYSENIAGIHSESKVRLNLSNSQKAVSGQIDESCILAVAKGNSLNDNFTFTEIFSTVKVEIPQNMSGKVRKIVLKSNDGQPVAGNLVLDCSSDKFSVTAGDEVFDEVTLSYEDEDGNPVPLESGSYSFSIFPGVIQGGLTATAFMESEDCTLSYAEEFEYEPNTIYTFGTFKQRFKGISGLPYIFSLQAESGSGNKLKYLTTSAQGKYNEETKFVDNYYYDESVSASLHAHFCGRTASDVRTSLFYSNTEGNDNIPAKSFPSKESAGDLWPGEAYYMLAVPHGCALPDEFNITFGLYTTNGGIADWNMFLSSDRESWEEAGQFTLKPGQYYHFTIPVAPVSVDLSAEQTLYVKFATTGNRRASDPENGAPTTGWGSDARLHSGIVIWTQQDREFQIPAGAIYSQSFEDMTGGSDYLWGPKTCTMLNYCGDSVADYDGMKAVNIRQRPGYAQVGWVNSYQDKKKYTNNPGSLTTPALGVTGKLKVSFDAMGYLTAAAWRDGASEDLADFKNPDVTSVLVNIIGGGTVNGTESVKISDLSVEQFNTYDFVIENSTPETRVEFTSPSDAVFSRWFIDNIAIVRLND